MEKEIITRTYCNKLWFWFVLSFLCVVTFSIHYFDLFASKNSLFSYNKSKIFHMPIPNNVTVPFSNEKNKSTQLYNESLDLVTINTTQVTAQVFTHDVDYCVGRYVYVHDLPSRFNDDILKNCATISKWTSMCKYVTNFGLGPKAKNSGNILQNSSWYATNQFTLEVIFHNRMKQYKCLTNDSALASAVYVPFYAGLDVYRYLFENTSSLVKDANAVELAKWLREKKEWRKMQGKDHFLVLGRISWDFRRPDDVGWGNRLLGLSEINNMTILGIESVSWSDNEFAIPYPTYFHPTKDSEIFEWQKKIRKKKRRFLYSFVGAPRPNNEKSIRGNIISQCLASKKRCKLLNCNNKDRCSNPVFVMDMFERSTFCLQPSGDSHTRRSTFDSILAGCIPVFFNPLSAYDQYKWHLPQDSKDYSVFIPEEGLRNGTVKLEKVLGQITKEEVRSMREEVIGLVPNVIYADPRASLETVEDAFDIAVDRVLERVDTFRREMQGE